MPLFRFCQKALFLVCLLFVMGMFMATEGNASAEPKTEQYKIVYLLNAVGESDLIFIRNGTEYSGEAARKHLQDKLDYAGDSIRTADDFIDLIASKSNMTGAPYHVRLANGNEIQAATWLRSKLAELN